MIGAILVFLGIGLLAYVICELLLGEDFYATLRFPKKYNIQDEMNMLDEAEWIKKVIRSCKTTSQAWNAYKLSKLLRAKYKNKVESKTIWLASDEVSKVFDSQYDKLCYKYESRRIDLSCN